MVEQKGFHKLMLMLKDVLNRPNETFIIVIEAVCALARYVHDHSVQSQPTITGRIFFFNLTVNKDTYESTPKTK